MFVKTLVRVTRAIAVLVCVSITSLAVAGFMALQAPSYYAGIRHERPTDGDVKRIERRLNEERAAYMAWQRRLAAIEADGPLPADHEVRFTAADLNTLIAADDRSEADGPLQDPFVRITPGKVELACALVTPPARLIVSAAMRPKITDDGVLTLELDGARIGWLPLPIKTIASQLPREKTRLSGKLHFDTTASPPRLTLDLSDGAERFRADSVECGEGEIVVRFKARPPAG